MPSTFVQLVCPNCQNLEASVDVMSLTVLTVTCTGCGHGWSADLTELPHAMREAAQVSASQALFASEHATNGHGAG